MKLSEDEFKCNLLRSENVINMMIKQIEEKDGALESNNEILVQMQAAIEGQTK